MIIKQLARSDPDYVILLYTNRGKEMSLKPKSCFLLVSVLGLGHAAIAQESNAGDIKEKLAMVNDQIESISNENVELEKRLSEMQDTIDELKRLSAQKDEELNSARED